MSQKNVGRLGTVDLIHTANRGAVVSIHVRPGSRTCSLQFDAGRLRLKLRERPVDGAANVAAIKALSAFCGVPKSSIEIIRGKRSKEKIFYFSGITAEDLREMIDHVLSETQTKKETLK